MSDEAASFPLIHSFPVNHILSTSRQSSVAPGAHRPTPLHQHRRLHLPEKHHHRVREDQFQVIVKDSVLKVVEWMHVHGLPFTADSMAAAASAGRLDIVEFLHYNRTESCATRPMDAAAQNGHLDIVKSLHYHRQEGCSLAMERAASYGRLDILRFLHEIRNEKCSAVVVEAAARSGHLHCIKYMHEQAFCAIFVEELDDLPVLQCSSRERRSPPWLQ